MRREQFEERFEIVTGECIDAGMKLRGEEGKRPDRGSFPRYPAPWAR